MSGVCDLSNRIGSYAPGNQPINMCIANIDAVDVQANHGSFTTLTVNGNDISTEFDDVTEKTQYITVGGGETTFLSNVVVPSLEISGGALSVPNITSTNITATNILTPDEFTSMKIGSATKNMISLSPGSTYVGVHTASPSYPLDVTGTTRISGSTLNTSTTQIMRVFVPSMTASTSNEAQIFFGVSSSIKRCGVLAYNYNDSGTGNTNKISLYNQGTSTPKLDIDSNEITVTGKFKPNGCTTNSAVTVIPEFTANKEFLIPVTSTNTLACRKFRVHLIDVQSTVTASIQVGGPTSYDSTATTYQRVVCEGNNAGSARGGTTSGMPYWNSILAPSVSGMITFEFVGTISSRQAWMVSGTLTSTTGTDYWATVGGLILMPSSNPVLTRISINGEPFLAGSYANVTYDA